MKAYIISALGESEKSRLIEGGIEYMPWDADKIAVTEKELSRTLAILDATVNHEEASEYEGWFSITLSFNRLSMSPAAATSYFDPARERSRANYVRAVSIRVEEEVKKARAQADEKLSVLAPVRDGFFQIARSDFVAGMTGGGVSLESLLAEQIERLLAVPKVHTVRVAAGAVVVYTDMLTATDPATGVTHEVGEFDIFISMDGSQDGVRWHNRTRRVRTVRADMNAPRVFADGTACADEIKATLLDLIARFDLATVAELAIQFVETPADDALSKHINKWPAVAGTGANVTAGNSSAADPVPLTHSRTSSWDLWKNWLSSLTR